jgi:hypothetical protein
MFRLVVFLILIGILILPIIAAEEEQNSSEEYQVREYALISFNDPESTDTLVNNTSVIQGSDEIAENTENQTRRGGELSARKLFQLKQNAQGDYRLLRNLSGDPSLGLSSTAAQSISILCKQCVPQKSGYY